MFCGMAAHKVSRFGSISLPTQPQPRVLSQSLHGISTGFPAPCPLPQFAGLQAKSRAGEAGGHCAVPAPLGLAAEIQGRTLSLVLQGTGSPGPPLWDVIHQHHSARPTPDVPSDGQGRDPCHSCARGPSSNLLPHCQRHGSMGLPAPDLLSLMVQRSQAQEGPTEAGTSAQLSLAPGRNKPFSCGALKALIPIRSPVSPSSAQFPGAWDRTDTLGTSAKPPDKP